MVRLTSAGGRRRGRARWRILSVLLAVVSGPFVGLIAPAHAGVSFGASPTFPSSAPVGATAVPATMELQNVSTAPDTIGSIVIQPVPGGSPYPLTMVPSCGSNFASPPGDCPTPDPGVLRVSPSASGESGTACGGMTFTVTVIDASTGRVAFGSASPVMLGPPGTATDTCIIDFTFDVLKSPTVDSQPGLPGLQTSQIGYASGMNSSTLNIGIGSNVSTVSIPGNNVSGFTSATSATLGSSVSDTATIVGAAGGAYPTGTMTFTAYGPNNSTCVAPAAFNSGPRPLTPSVPGPPPTSTASSGPFTPMNVGSYRWLAAYSGDANYLAAASPCGVPGETSVVSQATASLTTQALSPVSLGNPILDAATVTGAAAPAPAPTGTVSFSLYGPSNPTCTGSPIFTSPNRTLGGGPPPNATSATYTPSAAGSYNWIAVYSGDVNYASVVSPCGAASETSVVTGSASPSGRFTPLTPVRILDTRDGTGGIAAAVGPGATVEVQITGRGGVPASGVTAVAINVTATQPSASGYLILYPAGSSQPLASNLNFAAGKTIPNLVVVKPGAGGKVAMFNATGSTHVIYDVAGWYSDVPAGNAGRYTALTPARILDTRDGTGGGVRLSPGASLDVQVSSAGGVPASGVQAAVLNVAATGTTATGFLTVYPTGGARPLASNLNFSAGETVSNRAMVGLGTGGKVTIYNAAGSTDVIVDVGGWFSDSSVAGTKGVTTALTPSRILDTRDGTGGIAGPIGAAATVDVQVTGQGGVPPSGVSAVILNATVVSPAGPGWLTIFPTGAALPLASDLNYAAGENRANLVVVKVGTGGKVSLFTSAGAHVIFDVAGWVS